MLKMLDCFCGMGGVSDGFALEGFDVTGIDIVDAPKMLGYKHKFIQADMGTLKGEDFKGFDVVWGSPPCRDFSTFAKNYGKTWIKNPPNPEKGKLLALAFLKFANQAQPHFWIMENVRGMKPYIPIKPTFQTFLGRRERQQMERVFWGNFPPFLITSVNNLKPMRKNKGNFLPPESNSAKRARIPLACSRAFARACREQLEVTA